MLTICLRVPLGDSGMYRGTVSTFMRDVPFSIIYFSLYGIFRRKLVDDKGKISSENRHHRSHHLFSPLSVDQGCATRISRRLHCVAFPTDAQGAEW